MKEYVLRKDGTLYNFNISDADKAQGSKIVQRPKWGDGSPEFPNVGTKYYYDILVYGNPDDIDNKFPESADPEPEGDADANTPLPFDPTSLIPDEIVDKAKDVIGGVGVAVSTTVNSLTDPATGLVAKLQQAGDNKVGLEMASINLKALVAEAERVLAGGTPASYVPPSAPPSWPMPVRRLDSNGKLQTFNIDKTKPSRIVTARVLIKKGVDNDGQAIQEFETTDVKVHADLELLNQYYPIGIIT